MKNDGDNQKSGNARVTDSKVNNATVTGTVSIYPQADDTVNEEDKK